MTTIKAAFGGGVELVNLDEGSSIPLCFVFQLPDELTPTHVGDGATRGFDTLGQGTRPVDVKRIIHLGKSKLLAIPLEGRSHIACGLRPLFLVELGILSPPFKEVTSLRR